MEGGMHYKSEDRLHIEPLGSSASGSKADLQRR
jgi:hypothetical protein